jgi:hypothetical protein
LYADIGRELIKPASRSDALAAVSEIAVTRVPGVDWASITEGVDGRFSTVVATDENARAVDEIQYELGTGPCVDAITQDTTFRTGCLEDDQRWPEFSRRASDAFGVHSMLSFRLYLEDDSRIAGLNLYSTGPAAFDDDAETVGTLVATHGALAIAAATAREQATNLHRALVNSRQIGMAMGVLMATCKLTHAHAFDVLRVASQDSNRKLIDIATEVVNTGTLELRVGGNRTPTSGRSERLLDSYQAAVLRDSSDPDLLAELVRAVREHPVTGEGRGRVAMYLPTADVDALRRAGVRAEPVLLEPDAWIPVPAGGWDAWLEAMPSRKRLKIRREAHRFEEAGNTITHVGLADCYDRLPPVAESMAVKYGYPGRASDFLAEFTTYLRTTGPSARVALCEHDGRLTGFCLYYVQGDVVFLRWASFDYAHLTGTQEYFNVSYYSQVRIAGEVGARWLHAGKSALAAKVLRGAELRPLWLLDLTPGSPLEAAAAEVRRHNAGRLAALAADPVTGPAGAQPAEWRRYCTPAGSDSDA